MFGCPIIKTNPRESVETGDDFAHPLINLFPLIHLLHSFEGSFVSELKTRGLGETEVIQEVFEGLEGSINAAVSLMEYMPSPTFSAIPVLYIFKVGEYFSSLT